MLNTQQQSNMSNEATNPSYYERNSTKMPIEVQRF